MRIVICDGPTRDRGAVREFSSANGVQIRGAHQRRRSDRRIGHRHHDGCVSDETSRDVTIDEADDGAERTGPGDEVEGDEVVGRDVSSDGERRDVVEHVVVHCDAGQRRTKFCSTGGPLEVKRSRPRARRTRSDVRRDGPQPTDARGKRWHLKNMVAPLPVEQGRRNLTLVAHVQRVGEADHGMEQLAAGTGRQCGNSVTDRGGDTVTVDLGDAFIEEIAIVATIRSLTSVGVERLLENVRLGAQLMECNERHGEVVAEVLLNGRGKRQLGVEGSIESRVRPGTVELSVNMSRPYDFKFA